MDTCAINPAHPGPFTRHGDFFLCAMDERKAQVIFDELPEPGTPLFSEMILDAQDAMSAEESHDD